MIFASQIFLFWFLPLVLAAYFLLPWRFKGLLLLLSSWFFYAWWRVDFLVPLLASTLLDYACGRAIGRLDAAPEAALCAAARARRRRLWLWASLCGNLGLLGYFKYWNFGLDTVNGLVRPLGFGGFDWARVVLPMGISFYTFQSMSYTLDVYRGAARPVRNLVDFSAYVALFPQLVCGPIVRYREIDAQLRRRDHTAAKLASGALLFQMGFAKKLLLADPVAGLANAAFALPEPSCVEAWLGTLAYAFQIYFDFSGYSDMAIGLGLLFGFTFPVNFASPYQADSVTEFWRRWHITLSAWLRDYLYIPLGGNRRGPRRTAVNLTVTFLLCGLWHGAAWTFVAWGAWHGLWLVIERLAGRRSLLGRAPRPLRTAFTFLLVCLGWVFFRAGSFEQAFHWFQAMAGLGARPLAALDAFGVGRLEATVLCACAGIVWLLPNSQTVVAKAPRWILAAAPAAFLLAVAQLFFESYSPFLYFRF